MLPRTVRLAAVAALALTAVFASGTAASADVPSGERILGQSSIEPIYDAATGNIAYVKTPIHAPLNSNPRAWAPFYVPVYPDGSNVGTLLCAHEPADNCPDHGPEIAGLAMQAMHDVYGGGVLGHDHVADIPGGDDFNVSWEPVVVLFTKTEYVTHLTTDAEIKLAHDQGKVEEIPLAAAAFHCEVIPAGLYNRGTPVTPVS